MSKLVIVESAAKAKTINKYLGKEYKVRASLGHVRDLPKSKMGVDIAHDFAPDYVVIADRKKILTELKKLAKDADEVFLATDLDREGEAIAWHLASVLKLPSAKTRRVVFNEITQNAIREAFQSPSAVNENKVNAQQARRILDRIVGYQLSPLLWAKVRRGLSAGRVQSVVVRLIVEREREIEKFKPQEYWEIAADLAPLKPHSGEPAQFRAQLTKLDGKPIATVVTEQSGEERTAFAVASETQAKQLADELRSARFVVTRCDRKERSLAAAAAVQHQHAPAAGLHPAPLQHPEDYAPRPAAVRGRRAGPGGRRRPHHLHANRFPARGRAGRRRVPRLHLQRVLEGLPAREGAALQVGQGRAGRARGGASQPPPGERPKRSSRSSSRTSSASTI